MVHDDQSIPPGLHVRMNLATGLKEARLNIPEPEDAPKADIVVVDNTPIRLAADEEAEAEPVTQPGLQDQSQPERDYDYLRPSLDPEEASLFALETSNLRSSSIPTLETLEALTDLVHSYDWGLALAQDGLLIDKLANIFQPYSETHAPIEIRSATALLLGTAIQNNPEALTALLSHREEPTRGVLEQDVLHSVISTLTLKLEQDSPIALLQLHQRNVFVVYQLASSPAQLRHFISWQGLDSLHDLFTFCNTDPRDTNAPFDPSRISPGSGGEGRDKLRQRIANLMLDHVLPLIGSSEGRRYMSVYENMNETDYARMAQAIGNRWRRRLEPWDEAFGAALREYAIIMSEKQESEAPTVYKAYESISEAALFLKKVLDGDLY